MSKPLTLQREDDKEILINMIRADIPVVALMGFLCGALQQSSDAKERKLGDKIDGFAKKLLTPIIKDAYKGLN